MKVSSRKSIDPRELLPLIQFNEQGHVPAVIQDYKSKKVLTLCYLDKEALEKTLEEGMVYVFRRSQNRLMLKGESSGHIQLIKQVFVDCEGKSLLFMIKQHVAGCHAGYFSCYYRKLSENGKLAISEKKVFNPSKVYKK